MKAEAEVGRMSCQAVLGHLYRQIRIVAGYQYAGAHRAQRKQDWMKEKAEHRWMRMVADFLSQEASVASGVEAYYRSWHFGLEEQSLGEEAA